MSKDKKVNGPDLKRGVPTDDITEGGMLAGHVDESAGVDRARK